MAVPTLRLVGGPTSYQVFAMTGALWARVRGRNDELCSELISESPQPQCLATFRYDTYQRAFAGTDHTDAPLATLTPRMDRFAAMAGWRLSVPVQGLDAVSRAGAGWLGLKGQAPLDVEFVAHQYPILRVREIPGPARSWDLLSPRTARGDVLDWRVAVLTAVCLTDLQLRS